MSEWQPIETAPKGELILLHGTQDKHEMVNMGGPVTFAGYWDACDGAWCSVGSTWSGPFYTPTHWMRLPSPPTLPLHGEDE